MKSIKIDQKFPDQSAINKAANTILDGGLIIYPTDTSYGIGVDATNEKSIKKLYQIKNRKADKPTHVVVKDWKMIKKLTITNKSIRLLFEKLIPGPLTIVLEKRPDSPIPDILTGDLLTLGVRIPDFKITKMLSKNLDIPYTTPSANRSGEKTPYAIDEVKKVLDINKVDIVLDAGSLPKNLPSTLVDLTKKSFEIVREGGISSEKIQEILKQNR